MRERGREREREREYSGFSCKVEDGLPWESGKIKAIVGANHENKARPRWQKSISQQTNWYFYREREREKS